MEQTNDSAEANLLGTMQQGTFNLQGVEICKSIIFFLNLKQLLMIKIAF